MKPTWSKLTPTMKFNLWLIRDPLVPPGWEPEHIPEGKGSARQVQRTYLEPAAAVIELTPSLLSLPEDKLWALLVSTWDEQGISPLRVIFRAKGKQVLSMLNPFVTSGPLPHPVAK